MFKKNDFSHHALLFRGEKETIIPILEEALAIPFSTQPSSDISYTSLESLGIDEVRRLSFLALTKPIGGEVFRIIVVADDITFESQNALLKLTEDPPASARFMFIVPSSLPILSTLQSRFVEHVIASQAPHVPKKDTTLAEQLKMIAVLTKNKNNAGMEMILRESETRIHGTADSTKASRALMLARRFIEARGASSKILLEHLAIAEAESHLR